MMHNTRPEAAPDARVRALARWDNEGGALAATTLDAHTTLPEMTNAELVLLRVRVIALENLLIVLLAEGSDNQRRAACEMADIISPRVGATPHVLTRRAAQHMIDLVDRAVHIKGMQA